MYAEQSVENLDNQQVQVEQNVVDSNNVISTPIPTPTPTGSQNSIPDESSIGNKRSLTSEVWNHFKRRLIDGKWKAVCNYCDSKLLGESKQGTSHLKNHFAKCPLQTQRDIRQSFIKTEKKGRDTIVVGSYAFNQDMARRELAKMIILHEYPLGIVDHLGFKSFCTTLQPLFKVVSRNTIKRDCMTLYEAGKEVFKKKLAKIQSRVAITTDMWTSSYQNKGYMTVTTHYIDDSWTLQSQLVRFSNYNHK